MTKSFLFFEFFWKAVERSNSVLRHKRWLTYGMPRRRQKGRGTWWIVFACLSVVKLRIGDGRINQKRCLDVSWMKKHNHKDRTDAKRNVGRNGCNTSDGLRRLVADIWIFAFRRAEKAATVNKKNCLFEQEALQGYQSNGMYGFGYQKIVVFASAYDILRIAAGEVHIEWENAWQGISYEMSRNYCFPHWQGFCPMLYFFMLARMNFT